MRQHRDGQRGQVAVLFAIGSVALIGFVGLVLMAGLLYWDQRTLQADADGAALAGAVQISDGSCSSAQPVRAADQFLAQQLNTTSNLNAGLWACGTAVTDSFGNGYAATYTYSWNGKKDEIAVSLSRSNISLPFVLIGTLKPNATASIAARAVAQHNFVIPPSSFALFAQNGATCQGSAVKTASPKIYVNGSIYSGAVITPTGNCVLFAKQSLGFDGTLDYGDVLVYQDGQSWAGGGGSCGVPSGTPGNAVCADGFELSGHVSPSCGNNAGTSPQTEYLAGAQSGNPDPCQGVPPPVPQLNEVNYQPPEPNANVIITSTIGGPCQQPSGVNPGGTLTRSNLLTTGGSTYGWGPAPVITGSTATFQPGCYGFLDIGTFQASNKTLSLHLKPGFYYFNGYDCSADSGAHCGSTGGGICLNPNTGSSSVILGATDVSMEFVNTTSFSSSTCAASPSSACGGSACDFGTSITAPDPSNISVGCATSGSTFPAGVTFNFAMTYVDSLGNSITGETDATTFSLTTSKICGPVTVNLTKPSSAPVEATGFNVYLLSCTGSSSCSNGSIPPGLLGQQPTSGTLSFDNSTVKGNYVVPVTTVTGTLGSNTASLWFAAPPTSPESPPPAPALAPLSGGTSNLPAGSYTVVATYLDPEGETPASSSATLSLNASDQQLQMTTGAAPQGVTLVRFYLTAAPAGVTTGYIGQIAAPVGQSSTFALTSTQQANSSVTPPTTNGTSSSWCSSALFQAAGYSLPDATTAAASCANRLLWAPSSSWSGGQIQGTFYVKGSNENSAIMGNIYWPGGASPPTTPTAQAAGCNFDANGVGGLVGQVICDSVFVQGGASAGSATIGWTTGAKYNNPPEIALIE